jgi:hypothetical protein
MAMGSVLGIINRIAKVAARVLLGWMKSNDNSNSLERNGRKA